jgi:hypothetical protein
MMNDVAHTGSQAEALVRECQSISQGFQTQHAMWELVNIFSKLSISKQGKEASLDPFHCPSDL